MPTPFRQTYHIEGELIGLKRQIQSLSRCHLSPRDDLPLVKRSKPPAQAPYSLIAGGG